ncbi:hypothetical protein Bca52824_040804 [Brassica carinata]|uniref:Uncharacterized protein n=1 Tax=Brassica carinata TaxID=52824 RepID=A0A8X7UVV2_BRACI|nr:hypothetical protein Bca52824_040804 [Brassica carinata]
MRKHQYLKMQIVISTNDYRGSINFTTNLSQLDLDLRLQLPKLPLPSINTYNSYSFFSYQGVEQYQGHEILLDSIKAVLSYTVGYAVIFSKEMQKMVRSCDLSN